MRLIYITQQKHFIPPFRRESKTYGDYVAVFEDYTTNFMNLLYWNSDNDLNNRTLKNVLHKLGLAISRLEKENVKPREYKDDDFNPFWIFGHQGVKDTCHTEDLPDEERKSILLLHLLELYHDLEKIDKKNKTFYCYIFPQ